MLQHPSGGQRATWSSLTQLGPRAQKKMSLFTSSMGNPKWVLPIDKVSISHLSSGFKSLYHSPFQTSILNSTCCQKEADLMMWPVPNKSLDDRAGPWMRATSWKTTVFDNLLYRTLPEPCSTSPPIPPSEKTYVHFANIPAGDTPKPQRPFSLNGGITAHAHLLLQISLYF